MVDLCNRNVVLLRLSGVQLETLATIGAVKREEPIGVQQDRKLPAVLGHGAYSTVLNTPLIIMW